MKRRPRESQVDFDSWARKLKQTTAVVVTKDGFPVWGTLWNVPIGPSSLVASKTDGKPYFLPSFPQLQIGECCCTHLLNWSMTQRLLRRTWVSMLFAGPELWWGALSAQRGHFFSFSQGYLRSVAVNLLHWSSLLDHLSKANWTRGERSKWHLQTTLNAT